MLNRSHIYTAIALIFAATNSSCQAQEKSSNCRISANIGNQSGEILDGFLREFAVNHQMEYFHEEGSVVGLPDSVIGLRSAQVEVIAQNSFQANRYTIAFFAGDSGSSHSSLRLCRKMYRDIAELPGISVSLSE